MDRVYDVIILGGGPAGYTAALYAVRAGLDILLIEQYSAGGQMTETTQIDNYPGFADGIDGFTLGMQMQSGAERFGAVTVQAEIQAVDLINQPKRITADGIEYFAKSIILATGAAHRHLGIEGEKVFIGKGVGYCAACDGMLYRGKTVAVVGGGNSAVADALYLSRICKKVYVIHRRDTLRATKIYHDPLLRAENVEFLWDSRVTELIGDRKLTSVRIENVKTGNSNVLDLDGLFISIGRKPVTALYEGEIDLDEGGYVIADETTKTNLPGVFAAGDLRTKALRQIVTAAADGAVAAHFAEEYLATI